MSQKSKPVTVILTATICFVASPALSIEADSNGNVIKKWDAIQSAFRSGALLALDQNGVLDGSAVADSALPFEYMAQTGGREAPFADSPPPRQQQLTREQATQVRDLASPFTDSPPPPSRSNQLVQKFRDLASPFSDGPPPPPSRS